MARSNALDDIYDRYCDETDVRLCTTAVKRRGGGRPNRGGGRGNPGGGRGRGQRGGRGGGGSSRGRGAPSAPSSARREGARRPGPGYPGIHGRSRDRNPVPYVANDLTDVDIITSNLNQNHRPSSNRSKVALQHLHMSAENQALVRETLQHLQSAQGSDVPVEEEDDFIDPEDFEEELDVRLEDQYWTESSQLVVEDTTNFADTDEDPINNQELELQLAYKRAVDRVQRYGFERGRCEQALDMVDGDIGRALELLLCMCCDITLDSGDSGGTLDPDLLEQRQDEMFALTAIYEDAFSERIANRVWVVQLELPFLNNHFKKLISSNSRRTLVYDDDESVEICPWYLKGNCKFGRRCRYRHVNPHVAEQERKNDPSQIKYMYELEIRFPPGHTYPLKPPLVAFSSLNPLVSPHVCLNVTVYLLQSALEMSSEGCDAGQPLVFQLVSLLEDEGKLQELCDLPPHEFSNPQPIIYRTPRVQNNAGKIESPAKNTAKEESPEPSVSDNRKESPGEPDNKQREHKPHKKRNDGSPQKVNLSQIRRLNSQLKDRFRKVQEQPAYKSMQSTRQQLPAWSHQDTILDALDLSQVLVISGATGCGKTTQVPQFIMDHWLSRPGQDHCNILCTQPRRLSATAVAQRVANERTEKLGGSVGYQIRLESVMSSSTRLLFCTTGILLRRLVGDVLLEGVSHVILDEVHERSRESDFLLMVLRDLVKKRTDLKVILMSATLNADLFADYFGGCPVVEIPGRTFPVEQLFMEDVLEVTGYTIEERSPFANSKQKISKAQGPSLEELEQGLAELSYGLQEEPPKLNVMDHRLSLKQLFLRYMDYSKTTIKTLAMMDMEKINYDLIERVLTYIVEGDHEYPEEGAILVFLPGMQEITTMYEQLLASRTFGGNNKHRYWLIPLHSTLASEDQQRVFKRPKKGITKIVLSTNIAETSITIDDVVFVVDCGHMKEKRYDASKGMESLDTVWVSRANALQRKGRAGRVAAGVCFHLFTSHRYENSIQEQPIPEIQRVPLEQLVLWIKTLPLFSEITLQGVFSALVEPPTTESIRASVCRLEQLGALDPEQQLTPLGYHLAQLPVDVRIGKLMIFGAVFRCLDATLTIAASLSFKSPFVSPFDKREEADKKKQEFAVGSSDHLTMLKAYKGWQEAQGRGSHAGYCYCQENYLSINTLKMLCSMKQQFAVLLSDIGFISEGLTTRAMERHGRYGTDGVAAVTGAEANSNSANLKLVAALLVAALYPNVVQVRTPETKFQQTGAGAVPKAPRAEELRFSTKKDGFVHIHPSSVNFQVRYYESPYLVYHEMVKTSKVYIRDCTMVPVYPLLLFCGGTVTIDLHHGQNLLSVDDGWIRFVVQSHEVATLVRELRLELDRLLQDKIESPSMDLATCPRGSKIIQTIVRLVTTQ